ncbi:MAG: TniQ family protein [Methylotenera sp.]|uniref:TniQ family protein n=1 Tax=Methylotenera sp. TaxID=2051956 RepID=UPI0027305651|nr:TniQ family protein [Methylotenera sp.]MDP2071953.1 TniQ family protein [Methylotenera sp.]
MKHTREHQVLTVDDSIQPLVITPSPVKGESLPGFILRTAELNGYDSPMKLLHYAGMDDNEARSARPPLDKLAGLYGKTAAELKAAGLDSADTQHTGRHLQVMGHSIPSMFTRSKHAGVCLECVEAHGYIDGFHELKYAVACPMHQIRTINTCPSCQQLLSWHRAGLTRCRCGADLSQIAPEKLNNPAMLALLGILYAKLMRQPLNTEQIEDCGFPLAAIEQMSIQTLLSMIYRFGLFNNKHNHSGADDDADWMAVKTTTDVLSDWPHRFHDYLEQVHAPSANLKVSGLRGQFNSFYESFFKNIRQDNELQFMREAFISFGQNRWRQASMHPKLSQLSSGQAMGMQQLANQLGVQPSTLRKMIADKVINVEVNELNATRKLVTLSVQQPFEFASGSRWSLKQAAQQLDIPVEILRAYRSHGYYEAKHFVAPMHMFHERDIEVLHKRLMQGMQFKVPFLIVKHHITLAQVMRLKISSEMKAMWLNAVSRRQILAVGTTSALPSGLVFDVHNVKSYLDKIKIALHNTLSFNEVQSELKINRSTLFALVKHGLLTKAYLQPYGLRITENSFNYFNNNMTACREVALLKNTTQKAVLELCRQMRIPVIQIRSSSHRSQVTCWIPKFKLNLLGVGLGIQHLLAA